MDAEESAATPCGRRWLRVSAAAELLDVSQHTLRRWADSGVVPSRRTPSGQRQFSRSALERLAADHGAAARAAAGPVPSGTGGGSGGGNGGRGGPGTAALRGLAHSVATAGDPREALELIARRAVEVLGVTQCVIFEYDPALDTLAPRAMAGRDAARQDAPLPEPAARRAVLHAAELLEEHADGESRLSVAFGVGPAANGCVTLIEAGAQRRFSQDELTLAREFGDLAALAVHRCQTQRRESDAAAREASLLHAGQSITSSLVLDEVLDAVAREVVDTFGARYCVIWEYVPDKDAIVERGGYAVGDRYTPQGEVIKLDERQREREILFGSGPVLETLSDPELDPKSRASMEKWGEKTCLSLPMRFGSERLGVLVVCETERERRFTAAELALAEGLATQASAAVHNAKMYRDLERRNEELVTSSRHERLLNDFSLELSSSLDLRTVLEAASRRICALLDATGCDIYSYEDDTLVCRAACLHGEILAEWAGKRFPLEAWDASRQAISEGATLAIASLDDPRLSAKERSLMQEYDQRALLVTPMKARGRVLGTVEIVQAGRERIFTADEIATAEACARMAGLAVDNATLYEHQAGHAQRLNSLLVAGRAVTSSLVIEDVLDTLTRTAAMSLKCPEALIFSYDGEADTLTMRSVYQEEPTIYEDLDKPYAVADYPSDRALLESDDVVVETISDADLPADVRESMEYHDEKTCLTVPLVFGGRPLGMLTLIETAAERVFSEAELEFVRGFGEQAAMAMNNAMLFESVKGLHLGNLKALSSALTAKDFYTIGHTARVAAYAVLLAEELGWSQRAIQQLEEATYLHDIGKIAVSDRVLLKSGILTDDEWALMRQHPTISAEIIAALLDDQYVRGVRHHHERFDGGGYPDGLAGAEIPLVARLLCVVDSYDAMSSRRVYRPALGYAECLRELDACSGSQFDPDMVDAFSRVLARMDEQRQELQTAVDAAAGSISAADHLALREPADRERPEYARILEVLRRTRRRHPVVETMVTEAPTDELRCMIVVDSDEDEDTAIPIGQVAFADDLEIETFAGRPRDANVVYVDQWGTWLAAAAAIRQNDGDVVGLVSACRAPREGSPPSALRSAVGDTFAEIMRGAAARQTRAEIESMTDALTGLYNHRHFHQRLHEQVDAALLGDRRLALLFCDIDRFKRLNDRFGHPAGDEVLRRVGHVLATSIRAGDVAARYGGDEFAVVLLDADAAEAQEVAERIRSSVAELRVAAGEKTSISIGIAALPGDGADGEELLAAADRAMYAAKEAGRDRVVQAGAPEPTAPASMRPLISP